MFHTWDVGLVHCCRLQLWVAIFWHKKTYIFWIHLGPSLRCGLQWRLVRQRQGGKWNSLSCVTAKFIPVQRTSKRDRFSPSNRDISRLCVSWNTTLSPEQGNLVESWKSMIWCFGVQRHKPPYRPCRHTNTHRSAMSSGSSLLASSSSFFFFFYTIMSVPWWIAAHR